MPDPSHVPSPVPPESPVPPVSPVSAAGQMDWERIAADPAFKSLLRDKRRFIVFWCVFFILFYFSLPLLVGYLPELMERRVIGPVNLAYLFALSQFIMTWALAAIYIRQAARFDKREHALLAQLV